MESGGRELSRTDASQTISEGNKTKNGQCAGTMNGAGVRGTAKVAFHMIQSTSKGDTKVDTKIIMGAVCTINYCM
jgi:hypothetical protein